MEKIETPATESFTEKPDSRDFGFVGYRDYKESEFYKRYVSARAKMPQTALDEIEGKKEVVPAKKSGVGRGVTTVIFGVLFLALCVLGRFLKSDDTIVASLLGVFDGRDLITAIMGFVSGDVSNVVDMASLAALAVAAVFAVFAVIGGIVVAAKGQGVGKLMKTGCTIQFFLSAIAFACSMARRLDLTIGLSVLIILSGVTALIVLTAPRKVKEKK